GEIDRRNLALGARSCCDLRATRSTLQLSSASVSVRVSRVLRETVRGKLQLGFRRAIETEGQSAGNRLPTSLANERLSRRSVRVIARRLCRRAEHGAMAQPI